MKKPTAKMMVVLEKLAEEGNFAHYMPWAGRHRPNAYYFLHRGWEHCTSSIPGLLDRGLVEKFQQDEYGNHRVRISGLGRKYLLECKAEAKP